MNDMNDFTDFDRLLDISANGYRPTPDAGRLNSMIARRAAHRRAAVVVGTAAALALLASTAYAFRGGDSRARLDPAGPDHVDVTVATVEPKTTEAEPTTTAAVEVEATEPKVTEPAAQEPKVTQPKPATTEAPTTTEQHYELQASQSYGSCAENPPYDIFYGTTKPGAKVVIESDFSERIEVHADGNGHWEVQVFFPTAPVDDPFTVYVVSGPYTRQFTFTHVSS